mmetsp:Transcript_5379/g.12641  ORF Transcript_5379/g.12641 Transcript_5379/m.12641 type:complete len:155 (-) Transcript_5379:1083-1547(-)
MRRCRTASVGLPLVANTTSKTPSLKSRLATPACSTVAMTSAPRPCHLEFSSSRSDTRPAGAPEIANDRQQKARNRKKRAHSPDGPWREGRDAPESSDEDDDEWGVDVAASKKKAGAAKGEAKKQKLTAVAGGGGEQEGGRQGHKDTHKPCQALG